MMHAVEERAVGNETHEEMEELMEEMMAGTLNESEQERLVSFMNQYPGPYGMMVSRMMGGWALGTGPYSQQVTGPGFGMMGGTGMGTTMFWVTTFIGIFLLVWLIVGILGIVYLVRALSKM